MFNWEILCVVVLTSYAATAIAREVGTIFNLTMYGDELLDDDDRRPYTEKELEALKYIKAYSESRTLLDVIAYPECDFSDWMYPSCCSTIEILDLPHEICIDMALEWRELKISLALNHNGEFMFSFEFLLGKICVGIPFMKKISLCGHLYHISGHLEPTIYLRACITVTVASVFEIRFYCLDATQMSLGGGNLLDQKWSLQRICENVPEERAMIAILLKNDKVIVEFNNPIPPELMEAMRKVFNTAVKAIRDTIMVVKNAVVETVKTVGNAIASAASSAWKWCKSIFG